MSLFMGKEAYLLLIIQKIVLIQGLYVQENSALMDPPLPAAVPALQLNHGSDPAKTPILTQNPGGVLIEIER